MLGGRTSSFSETFYNAYLVKVDPEGRIQWETSFGGDERDYATYAAQTRDGDGGFIFGGEASSPENRDNLYALKLLPVDLSGQARFIGLPIGGSCLRAVRLLAAERVLCRVRTAAGRL